MPLMRADSRRLNAVVLAGVAAVLIGPAIGANHVAAAAPSPAVENPGGPPLSHWPHALAISGTDLFVGGRHTDADGIPEADYIARWDGRGWSALGSNGAGDGALNGWVNTLAVANDILYVGGRFTDAGGIPEADYVAQWDGRAWSALGSNGTGDGALSCTTCSSSWGVDALAVVGGDLYVGGTFSDAAGIAAADRIAKWDGAQWSALGSDGRGNGVIAGTGHVNAIAGSGSELYVAGLFSNVAGLPEADAIARWDGRAWSALGSDGRANGALSGQISDLALVGSNLYVGGSFRTTAGGVATEGIASWDGGRWSALGEGLPRSLGRSVGGLAVSGTNLYAGGSLGLAHWDGAAWSVVLDQFDGVIQVTDIAVVGDELYVAGNYGGGGLGRWDGTTWGPLAPGEAPVRVPRPFHMSLPRPDQISLDPVIIAQTLLFTGGLLLLVPFPSTLFNNTLEAHYSEIVGRARAVRRRVTQPIAGLLGRLRGHSTDRQPEGDFWRTFQGIAFFVVLTALLSCLLDPTIGLDLASLATFGGMLAGLVLLQVVSMLPTIGHALRGGALSYRALPGTFVVAVACVLISRWADFQPGYLYGMIIGTIAAADPGRVAEGRAAAVGAAVTLGVALASWLALGMLAVPASATVEPGLADSALRTALTTVIVGGVVGTGFGLVPVRYLPGGKIRAWRPPVLAVLAALTAAFFFHVILNPANGYLADATRTPLATVVILLVSFTSASVALWAYFRLRRQPASVTTGA